MPVVRAPFASSSDAEAPVIGHRRWIDLALVVSGVACALTGLPVIAAALTTLGVALPLVTWVGGRRVEHSRLRALVPDEVSSAYDDLTAAAVLPGVADQRAYAERIADDVLLETAAVLAGRQPRGAAQRRHVEARVEVMQAMAGQLRERQEAWAAACVEVEALDPLCPVDAAQTSPSPSSSEPHGGWSATVILVLLLPVFLAWDLVRGIARGVVAFADGVALRSRLVVDLLLRVVRGAGRALVDALRQWSVLRDRVVRATIEARRRFVSARFAVRLRLRRVRSRVPRIP